MPCDCGLLCLFTERRRHIEVLWRRRLLVTDDERKAKRRFLNLMRGFDTEDLDVLRKAIESGGVNIKQCAPGPPMDLIEEREESSSSGEEAEQEPEMMPGCSATIVSTRPQHSIKQMERDRILFQRQRFPTVASIQHQPATSSTAAAGGVLVPMPTTAVPTSPGGPGSAGGYQRRYSTHREQLQRNRRDSKFSRRFAVYTSAAEEGAGGHSLRPLTTTIISANSPRTGSSSDAEMDTAVDEFSNATERRRRHHRRQRRRQSLEDEESQVGGDGTTASPARGQLMTQPSMNPDAGLIPQIDKPMSMPYLCCKMWRWKDLQVDAALHRLDPLPWCRFGRVTINNATVSCCNPFHYGLWIKPETASASSDEQSIASGVLANGGQRQQQKCDVTGSPLLTAATGISSLLGDTTIGHVRSAFHHSLQAARAAYSGADADSELPPQTPPPAPPQETTMVGNSSEWQMMANHHHFAAAGGATIGATNRRISHSVHCQAMSWGRMVRWQQNERVGEVVTLLGQFAVVGRLAGTVFDGQDVKTAWDVDNAASFALLRQSSDEVSETLDEVWLYNSSDQPLFMCISRNVARASAPPSDTAHAPNIRRLSPGYCVRVHRICAASPAAIVSSADHPPLLSTASPLHRHQLVGGSDHLLLSSSSFGHPLITTSAAASAGDGGVVEVMPPSMPTAQQQQQQQPNATTTAALSLLTISVGIGWGANYECRRVTDLPCRYEVIFT